METDGNRAWGTHVWLRARDVSIEIGDEPLEAWVEAMHPVWSRELSARVFRHSFKQRRRRVRSRTAGEPEEAGGGEESDQEDARCVVVCIFWLVLRAGRWDGRGGRDGTHEGRQGGAELVCCEFHSFCYIHFFFVSCWCYVAHTKPPLFVPIGDWKISEQRLDASLYDPNILVHFYYYFFCVFSSQLS